MTENSLDKFTQISLILYQSFRRLCGIARCKHGEQCVASRSKRTVPVRLPTVKIGCCRQGGEIPLSLPGKGTCVYFRTPHRAAGTPMVGALALALAPPSGLPSAGRIPAPQLRAFKPLSIEKLLACFQVGIFDADGNGIICAWFSKTIRRLMRSWGARCACTPSSATDFSNPHTGSHSRSNSRRPAFRMFARTTCGHELRGLANGYANASPLLRASKPRQLNPSGSD